MRVAIFRPQERLEDSIALARSRGHELLLFPTIEMKIHEDSRFDEFLSFLTKGLIDYTVFTSSNGLRFARELAAKKGVFNIEEFVNGTKVVAIGGVTAKAIEKEGINATIVPREFSSRGIVDHFASMGGIKGRKVAILRSTSGSPALAAGLERLGASVLDVPVYSVELPMEMRGKRKFFKEALGGSIDAFAFTSSMTVTNFIKMAERLGIRDDVIGLLNRSIVAALGKPTKEALEANGIRVKIVPPSATFESLIDSLEKVV